MMQEHTPQLASILHELHEAVWVDQTTCRAASPAGVKELARRLSSL